MIHRHLTYSSKTPVARLPSAAIVDILDRGDLLAWRPIAAAIHRRPFGSFADRVRSLLDAYPMYGTSELWRAWIDRCRAAADSPQGPRPPIDLAALRQRMGLTQSAVAARMGISQSDLSKLERRSDVRVTTLRAYAKAVGGRLEVTFTNGAERFEVRVGRGGEQRRA